MTNLPKIFLYAAKTVGAIIITGVIVILIGTFNNSPVNDSSGAFDSIRESIYALINQDDPGQIFDSTEEPDDSFVPVLETTSQFDNNPPGYPLNANAKSEKPESDLGITEIIISNEKTLVFDLGKELQKSLRKSAVDIEVGELEIINKNVIAQANLPEELAELPSIRRLAVSDFNFNFESLDELISIALEFGINNIPLEEKQLESLIEHLRNAEYEFNIKTFNLQKIIGMGERVTLFASLDEQIRKISKDLGGLPECQYHKPILDINKDLEINGYYQEFDCHPELVKRMMEKIKTLPEWKKLSKKIYSP